MRTSILLALQRGAGKAELLAGPEVSLADQQAMLRKALASDRIDPDIVEVQHWTSDGGLQRSVKFRTPKRAKAETEQHAKDNAAHKASLEQKAKDEKQPAPTAPPPAPTPETPAAPTAPTEPEQPSTVTP